MVEDNRPPRVNWVLLCIIGSVLVFGFIAGFNLQGQFEKKADKGEVALELTKVSLKNEEQDKAIQALLISTSLLTQNVDRLVKSIEKEK